MRLLVTTMAVLAAIGVGSTIVAAPAKMPPRLPKHVTPDAEKAIQKGLNWLSTHQSRDGSWSTEEGFSGYAVSMTALAGLAMTASGSTPTQGPYAPQVARAVSYLVNSAQEDGLISRGGEEATHSMYGHGFSMLFLGQVYGMEEDRERQRRLQRVLQAAVRLTDQAQSNLGGWYYTPSSGYDEGSVTVTQVQGLRSCRNVGITVPKRVIDGAMKYLEKSSLPGGGIAYRVGMTDPRPPITAAAVVCWFNAGQSETALCRQNLRYCIDVIGSGSGDGRVWGHYFYAHMYMAQAMYLSGDKNWDKYYPKMRDKLLAMQADDGSWRGDSVGETYGTSIALLILQLPYQYLPIMQR